MPIKKHVPQQWGKSVGGVSERAGVKAGESNFSAMLTKAILRVSWR